MSACRGRLTTYELPRDEELPFSFFIMRKPHDGVPPEIDEAAQLGASWWLVFTRFNLPLSRSALAAAFTSSSSGC